MYKRCWFSGRFQGKGGIYLVFGIGGLHVVKFEQKQIFVRNSSHPINLRFSRFAHL